MPSLTIRNLEPDTKERLRVRAAQHGHSMEEEARVILKRAVGSATGASLLDLSRQLFGTDKGIEITLPDRAFDRFAPDFGDV